MNINTYCNQTNTLLYLILKNSICFNDAHVEGR